MKSLIKNILIIANGEEPPKEKAMNLSSEADYVIAADGGFLICQKLGINPDIVIGDIDSSGLTESAEKNIKIIRIEEQVSTDLEKALKYCNDLEPEQVNIMACFGKRADHTFGNMFIMYKYRGKAKLTMFDNFGFMSFLDEGSHVLTGTKGQIFSLFTPQPIQKLSLSGFKYPLNNYASYGGFIGVSNEFAEEKAQVSFRGGRILYYIMDKSD